MTDELLVERRGALALLTLNRPQVRNALSISLRLTLADAIDAAAKEPEVRAVVLAGAGTTFCSGMDRTQFGTDPEGLYRSTVQLFRALRDCPLPLVAAVQGPAVGGGFAVALAADLRAGGPDAWFATPEIEQGFPPSWGLLRGVLGDARAAEIALTGRRVGAEEAHRIGLLAVVAERTEDVLDASLRLAERVTRHPERGVRMLKALMANDRARSFWPSMEDELALFRAGLGLSDLPDVP